MLKKYYKYLGALFVSVSPAIVLVSCSSGKAKQNYDNWNTNVNHQITKKSIDDALNDLSDEVISYHSKNNMAHSLEYFEVNDKVDVSLLGLPHNYWIFPNGMIGSYRITEKYANGTVKVILKISSINNDWLYGTKNITVHSDFNFAFDKGQFPDIRSTKIAKVLSRDVVPNNATPEQLGFIENPLSPGTVATYSVSTTNFVGTTPILVTVHLNHGGKKTTTTFHLTPTAEHNFTYDKTLFHDMLSTKTATQLNTDVITNNPTASNLGIIIHNLATTTITYSIPTTTTFVGQDPVVVTVHLLNNGATDTATFNLTPAFDFTAYIAKFTSFTSTKTANELNASAIKNTPTATDLGITTPILENGVSVTYSMESTSFSDSNPVVITAHLSHNEESTTTTFNLIPKSNIATRKLLLN